MVSPGQICLVAGHNRGFTRTIVEALLKRGSKVIFTCSNPEIGDNEQFRLGQLYGSSKVHCAHIDHTEESALDKLFNKTLDIFGGVNLMVSATAQDSIKIKDGLPASDMEELDNKIEDLVVENDVEGIRRSYSLAVKYMGRQNGFTGGTLLNIASTTELGGATGRRGTGCTVLGATRGLGMSRLVDQHGVKVVTMYQPIIDYPDMMTPYSHNSSYVGSYSPSTVKNDKMWYYSREYTGYMTLHAAHTAPAGTAWAFGPGLKLNEVTADHINASCRIANKMCFWLGCPMYDEDSLITQTGQRSARNEVQAPAVPSKERQDN